MRNVLWVMLLVMMGCSDSGWKVNGPPRWVDCVDFRDGEKFSFHTSTVKASGSYGHPDITIVDAHGHIRNLTEYSQHVKCLSRSPDTFTDNVEH